MALTIRKIGEEERKLLDIYKKQRSIATDSKALLRALKEAILLKSEMEKLENAKNQETTRADNAERILETLRDTMKSALTMLDQQELQL